MTHEDQSPKSELLRKVTVTGLLMFIMEPFAVYLFPGFARMLPPVFAHGAVLVILVAASLIWGRSTTWRKRVVTATVIAGLLAGFWAWFFAGIARERPFDVCHRAASLGLVSDDDFSWPNDWDAEPHITFAWPGEYTCEFSGKYAGTAFSLPIPTLISVSRMLST